MFIKVALEKILGEKKYGCISIELHFSLKKYMVAYIVWCALLVKQY